MIPISRLIKSALPIITSGMSRASAVNWTPNFGKSRSVVRFLSDDLKCPSCNQIISGEEEIKGMIESPGKDSFDKISTLVGRCYNVNEKGFTDEMRKVKCIAMDRLDAVIEHVLHKGVPNVIYYDKGSSRLIMSVFLKRKDLSKRESDLTGDGGLLAFGRLRDRNELNAFSNIIDIGGQDSDFVNQILSENKNISAIIIDINTLCWALDKGEGISYAIGAASNIFRDQSFLPDKERSRTIFTMNNLINVLLPEEASETLAVTAGRMNVGDRLIITNLSKEQFTGKVGFYENPENNGMHVIDKTKTEKGVAVKERYKTTISDKFVSFILGKFPSLTLVEDPKLSVMKCRVPVGSSGRTMVMDVKFITVMFERKADKERDI